MKQVQLNKNFDTGTYTPGASKAKIAFWYVTSVIFFESKLIPSGSVLIFFLRLFGAKIGKNVRLKPGLKVKFPWRLRIGDNSWIADCCIENLAPVSIGKHCCISQQAMLMTGNHNYRSENFDLIVKPIVLEDGAWVGAGSIVGPGVTIHAHSVLSLGSVATKNLEPNIIYQGNPAKPIRSRF